VASHVKDTRLSPSLLSLLLCRGRAWEWG